jgi:hypothetical protein
LLYNFGINFDINVGKATLGQNFVVTIWKAACEHAVQRGIWVPTQYLLYDRENPRKILFELAERRTYRMQTYLTPSVSESDIPLNNIHKFISYCTENTMRRHS